ncbi:MAG: hypothetical protein AAB890_02995 [Patescibacteria group bacterium]
MKFLIKKETLATIILIAFVSVFNGKAGSKIIWGLAKDYINKKKSQNNKIKLNYGTFRVILGRLQKDGLVKRNGWGIWQITEKGIALINSFKKENKNIVKKENKRADIIIVFDVPETERKKRNYLRFKLISLGFKPLQKSVWMGNGPLSEEFLDELRNLNLLNYIHIFSINKYGTI